MIRRLYMKIVSGAALRTAARSGLLELEEGVTTSDQFEIKLHGTRKGQLRVGRKTRLDGRIVVRGEGSVEIGEYCSFRAGTYIGCVLGVRISSNVFGAEGVFVSDNNNHPVDPALRLEMTRSPIGGPLWSWVAPGVDASPVVIGENVWLGRNCAVLKGVNIGRDSIVALGAVVTKSADAGSVIAGNPAAVVKHISTMGQ